MFVSHLQTITRQTQIYATSAQRLRHCINVIQMFCACRVVMQGIPRNMVIT